MAVGYNPSIVSDGLVFYIDAASSRCYSGSGNTANGLVGGIGGTLVNGVSFNSANNGSFQFDGANDYIEVDDLNVNFSNGLTVCAFCYPTANSNWGRIIDFGLGQSNDNIILSRLNTSNVFFLEVRSGTDANQSLIASSSSVLVNNKFQYLCGVVDAGTPGNASTARLYYNGNLIPSSPTGNIVVPNTVNRTINYIARSNWSADSYFQGNIGQVIIYNRALTQQEILQNFNATRFRYGI